MRTGAERSAAERRATVQLHVSIARTSFVVERFTFASPKQGFLRGAKDDTKSTPMGAGSVGAGNPAGVVPAMFRLQVVVHSRLWTRKWQQAAAVQEKTAATGQTASSSGPILSSVPGSG